MTKNNSSSSTSDETRELRRENDRLHRLVDRYRQSEESVASTAREWSRVFDSITDLVSVHDRDFRIVRANRAFADFLKMPVAELVGKHCF